MAGEKSGPRPRWAAGLRVGWLCALAGSVAAAGCGPGAPAETPAGLAAPRPNLLLVTLDTTRADRLGCYGARDASTPNLDRIAREGVLAERAVAVAPITLPSHASILTSLFPPRHGVRDNSDFRLPEAVTTLAEHLKGHGYRTAAAVGSYMLSSVFGVAQGFDRYDEPRPFAADAGPRGVGVRFREILERPASEVTDAAFSALAGAGERPFFLWTHYFDPHADYRPPPPYAERFQARPYDGEIAYTDAEVGRLLGALGKQGLLDSTLVVVTADHGESLGEHGELTHGLFVYQATLRVPLLMRWPGVLPAGRRLAAAVSVADIAPTVLELMGLPPLPDAQGQSFAAAARGGPEREQGPVYAESLLPERAYGWCRLVSIERSSLKLIEAPEPELYDLAADPNETRNLASARPADAADLSKRLREMLEAFGVEETSAPMPLDEEQRARLRSLGYLPSPRRTRTGASRPDPKRLVSIHNQLLEAQERIAAGELGRAAELVSRVLRADPGNPTALDLDGTLAFSAGRGREGLERLQAAARAAPGSHRTLRNLANGLHVAGRLEEAARAYREAIAIVPGDPEDHYGLANVLLAMKDHAGAIAEYREAIRLGLDVPPVRAALGSALAAAGDPEGAERELRAAVARDGKLAGAWNQLGLLAERAGRLDEAREHYRRALEADPDHVDALFNHAKAALRAGDLAAAREGVRRLLARRPDHPVGRYLDAEVCLASGDRDGAREALRRFIAQKNADPRLVGPAREMLAGLAP